MTTAEQRDQLNGHHPAPAGGDVAAATAFLAAVREGVHASDDAQRRHDEEVAQGAAEKAVAAERQRVAEEAARTKRESDEADRSLKVGNRVAGDAALNHYDGVAVTRGIEAARTRDAARTARGSGQRVPNMPVVDEMPTELDALRSAANQHAQLREGGRQPLTPAEASATIAEMPAQRAKYTEGVDPVNGPIRDIQPAPQPAAPQPRGRWRRRK